MAQKRPLKRDVSSGRISEIVSTDTVYCAAAPASGSDLTNQTYADSHIGGGASSGAITLGKLPIGQADGSVVWADPLVQGVYAPGTNTSTGGISSGPINPVLIGGSDYTGTPLLHDIKVDTSGNIYIGNASIAVTSDGTFEVVQDTAADFNCTAVLATGSAAIGVVSTKTALTASSPTAASVGVTSTSAVGANANRKGLVLVNTSVNAISLGFGVAAVLNSGITLNPTGGTFVMDEFTFHVGAVNAIASGAASNLAIQELTT